MLNEIYVSNHSKMSFLKGLINLAKVDGQIEESEIDILKNVAITMGLDYENIITLEMDARSDQNLIELNFDNKKQALLLIREGIQLCYIDGKYEASEKRMINIFAEILKISDVSVHKVESWVKEGIEWSDRGKLLLDLED